jgi:putative membrane protein
MSINPWRAGVSLLLVLAAGCAREERPAARQPRVERRAVPPTVQGQAISDSSYVARAGSIDLLIIASAKLALQRSSNARVRDFATMMIEAHTGTSAQLSLAGRRLNLLPSATMNSMHQAMLSDLGQAVDFDAVYRRQQRAIHEEALAVHTSYAAQGTSPTLRPVAKAVVPILERHLRLLKYL